jgi:hypothetical protein
MMLSRFTIPLLVLALLALFLVVRLPGLSVSYHQDEYKAAITASESLAEASVGLLHPPLLALLLRLDAVLFGGDSMRVLPLLFGLGSAVLLYLVVRRRAGETAARWSLALYTVSFYSIWASLMVDVDGAILPFFFLLSLYAYDRFTEAPSKTRFTVIIGACLLGLMTKLSFVLVIGAYILDYAWQHRSTLTKRDLVRGAVAVLGFGALTALALLAAGILNPAFRFDGMIQHALYYIQSDGRSWLQIFVQAVKALYYLSPLLLAPLVLLSFTHLERLRPLLIYLGVGALFYFVLFDFSHGALDKYLMFTIAPLAALSGVALSDALRSARLVTLRAGIVAGVVLSALMASTVLMSPAAMPLYPKTAWFASILHGNLNVLTPLTGGSGPAGFYVSFLFIALSFVVSLALALLARFVPRFRITALLALVVIGVSYNGVFLEEFAYGRLHGNANEALASMLPMVTEPVITFSDYGAYELTRKDAYAGRFYATPQFEESHVSRFAEHVDKGGGHFLVVGFPPLYEGFYTHFFEDCATVASTTTGVIQNRIYLCTQASE